MAYNDNIPLSTDLISTSQGQIKSNFQGIDSTVFGFARNHVALTDGTSGGLHKTVDYYIAVGDPTVSGYVASLYSKSIAGSNELVYSNATGVTTQITSGALPIWKGGTTASGVVTVTSNKLSLPNGLQFSYGSGTTNGSGEATVNFGFPNSLFSAILTRTITGGNNRGYVQWKTTPTNASGVVKMLDSSGNNIVGDFYWTAIGN